MVEVVEETLAAAKLESKMRLNRSFASKRAIRWMIEVFAVTASGAEIDELATALSQSYFEGLAQDHEVRPLETSRKLHQALASPNSDLDPACGPADFAVVMGQSLAAVRKWQEMLADEQQSDQLAGARPVQATPISVQLLCPSCASPVSVQITASLPAGNAKEESIHA